MKDDCRYIEALFTPYLRAISVGGIDLTYMKS